jgi:hypothetical protein
MVFALLRCRADLDEGMLQRFWILTLVPALCRARHAEAHPESVKEEVVSPEADKQGVEGKGEGEGEEQQQQQQQQEEEEEEEVPLFMQKKKTWGLGGAAVS